MKYCPFSTTLRNPASIQYLLNLSCCDSCSIRSSYCWNRKIWYAGSSLSKETCLDSTEHDWLSHHIRSPVPLKHVSIGCKRWLMARKVDEPWTKCRNRTDLDWTRAFAHDGRDPRSWPQTKPCRGQHVLEQSYTANQHGAWITCARCALRLHYIPRHTARMTSVSTPSSVSVQQALKRMSLFERQRLQSEGCEGHDCRSRGTEASKEETDTTNYHRVQHCVHFRSGIQCDDQLGNSSAQRNFDTTITSVLSDNSFVAPICCGHPPEEWVRRENALMMDEDLWKRCRDVWHGNSSEGHRWSMLVFQNKFKRCWMRRPLMDVILSRSAVLMFLAWPKPCNDVGSLRSHCCALMASETMTHRHVRIFLAGLPRNDLRRLGCHLRSLLIRTIRHAAVSDPERFFDSFLSMPAAALSNGGRIYWEWHAKCIGWSSVELREFRAQQESCGRELFMTACDSCFFEKKQFVGRSSSAVSHIWSSFQRLHESTVSWKLRTRVETNIRRKERISICNDSKVGERFCAWSPSSSAPHVFVWSLISRSFCCFICSRNREGYFSSGTCTCSKVDSSSPRFWWSCFKDEFGTVASASWLSFLDAANGWSAAVWFVSRIQWRPKCTTSLAGNASKTVAGGEGRYFRMGRFQRKSFFALYMDAACKLSSCSCLLEGHPRQRFEPNGATLISHLAKDWMQHFPQFQFLISDNGECFLSNELREWASIWGIGLLTAPGEFHGLTADLGNLIRVI